MPACSQTKEKEIEIEIEIDIKIEIYLISKREIKLDKMNNKGYWRRCGRCCARWARGRGRSDCS